MNRLALLIFGLVTAAALALSVMAITQNAIEADRQRDPEYVRMVVDRKYFEEVIAPAELPLHPAGHWSPIEKRTGAEAEKAE